MALGEAEGQPAGQPQDEVTAGGDDQHGILLRRVVECLKSTMVTPVLARAELTVDAGVLQVLAGIKLV